MVQGKRHEEPGPKVKGQCCPFQALGARPPLGTSVSFHLYGDSAPVRTSHGGVREPTRGGVRWGLRPGQQVPRERWSLTCSYTWKCGDETSSSSESKTLHPQGLGL